MDCVIAPEIAGDRFAETIRMIAGRSDVHSAIEIGSSNGAGSTRSLVDSMASKQERCLICLEVSGPRFQELVDRYHSQQWVQCIRASSVPIDALASEKEVLDFLDAHGGRQLYRRRASEVLRWLEQDRQYVRDHHLPQNGVIQAMDRAGVDRFDLALIDGSEFSGRAELELLYGAKYLLLDDVTTFKNHGNRMRLLRDDLYELFDEDLSCRNGFSVFKRI